MSSTLSTDYEKFRNWVCELKRLGSIESLLWWDQQTYMPQRGAENRAQQLATLASLIHTRKTDPSFVELTRSLNERSALDDDERVVVRETWRELERAILVPDALVRSLALLEAETHQRWLEARKESRFSIVQKSLEKLLDLKREYASAVALGKPLYDALLDLYEPDESAERITPIFAEVRTGLQRLLQAIVEAGGRDGITNPAQAPFPKSDQLFFCLDVVQILGFDFQAGRLDETVHPFCNGVGIRDVRLTTRFYEDDITHALMAALHEAGHGLYDQGMSVAHEYTPLAEAVSLGIHESQSLLWEKQVGRSKEFWSCIYPKLKAKFPVALQDVSFDTYYRFVNQVKPSFNRVSADEVSYGLHVILRFELERQLIEGKLAVGDLSEAWNSSYERYLGIRPPNDLVGVLQDTHWYSGLFGYFPTYLLGAMYSAQLFQAFERKRPAIRNEMAKGELGALKEWVNCEIHAHGKRFMARELIERASGEPPSAAPYLEYLNRKFGELYRIQ